MKLSLGVSAGVWHRCAPLLDVRSKSLDVADKIYEAGIRVRMGGITFLGALFDRSDVRRNVNWAPR